MTNIIINFDNNATTKVLDEVLAKMIEVYGFSGNSSSTHALGRKATMIIEDTRSALAQVLNAKNYEIYFTSGGTEANNMAIFADDFEEIFMAKFEHSSVYNARPKNCKITEIKVNKNGVIDLADLEEKLSKKTSKNFLVSIMQANNETGAIQPIKEAARLTHQHGGLFHCDMVQSFGKMPIDLEDLNVDFACVSSHKINGPQGVGATIVRKGIDIKPLIYGGGHEKGKRSGTMNNAGIAGFGVAIKNLDKKLANLKKVEELRDFIESEMLKIAGDNVKIFSKEVVRTPNTCYASIKNADGQTQMIHFDLNGIMVSGGSACSSGAVKASRVLEAMSVPYEFSNAVRISLCSSNTKEEAEKFLKVWKEFYNKIHK